MLAKLIIVLFLIAILFCLGSALYYLFSGHGNSRSMVKALTVRIVLSVILFFLLIFFFLTGVLHPHGVVVNSTILNADARNVVAA